MTAVARELEVPADVRGRVTLTTVDYVDRFVLQTERARSMSAEAWVRQVLERTPTGQSARVLWSRIGLELGPPGSLQHVQGWEVRGAAPDWVLLGASAWYVHAQAVCDVRDGQVGVTLFLQYRSPVARLLWAAIGVLHRRGVPQLLRHVAHEPENGPGSSRPFS